jgi:hypothetical protein
VSLRLVTADQQSIATPTQRLVVGETRWLVWDMLDAEPAQLPGARTTTSQVLLVLQALRAGTDYRVAFHEFECRAVAATPAVSIEPVRLRTAPERSVRLAWKPVPGALTCDTAPVAVTWERAGQVFLRAHTSLVAAPRWWVEQYPDECVAAVSAGGTRIAYEEPTGHRPGSWASTRWRTDMGRALTRFIQHLRTAPYGDRVLGVAICAGTTEEWMLPGSNTGDWTDYSQPAVDGFRAWLSDRYGTDEQLRAAWHESQVTLVHAAPPQIADAVAAGTGEFVDPAQGRRLADWWLYRTGKRGHVQFRWLSAQVRWVASMRTWYWHHLIDWTASIGN